MNQQLKSLATSFVEKNIENFHKARLVNLSKLQLKEILKRKNPYLFKAKNILTASDLVKAFMEARLSSQEETIFGEFLENLAIFLNSQIYNGKKSSAEGIDLEFDKQGIRYIVSIKSGPAWGNSSQIARMKDNFKKAKRVLNTNTSTTNIVAVNGCCYGRDNAPDKGDYMKLCGQSFWEFISGDNDLYLEIIEPLGFKAKERNEEFSTEYAALLNRFTLEFANEYCIDGYINWEKLVKFNSEKKVLISQKNLNSNKIL